MANAIIPLSIQFNRIATLLDEANTLQLAVYKGEDRFDIHRDLADLIELFENLATQAEENEND